MINDLTARNELNDYLINVILEKEVHWRNDKLKGSGKSPAETSNTKKSKLAREVGNFSDPRITPERRAALADRVKKMNVATMGNAAINPGTKERPSVRSRGQSPQQKRDSNTLTGTLSKISASSRTDGVGNKVGGQTRDEITGGRYGDNSTGRSGSKIRNKAVAASTTTTLGVKRESCFDLISDLIEANPPKPNALQTINRKHHNRTHGMTAHSSYTKDGNIKIGDVFLPPSERGKGRVRKPKSTNEEIITRFHDRIDEKLAHKFPLSPKELASAKAIGDIGRGIKPKTTEPTTVQTKIKSKRKTDLSKVIIK